MLFSSMTFIYVFLPLLLLLCLIAKESLHNSILLVASIIFYAWGEPKNLAIMLLTIVVNYYGAVCIDKYSDKKKTALILTIIVNISFLIYFKYFNFIIENIRAVFPVHMSAVEVIMPIGISFYIFQAISYLVDVYRGETTVQKDIYKLALYICLFPQLIAGPIVKYHDVKEQIDNRSITFDNVSVGVKRFIIGLAKKVLIANTMGGIADKIFIQPADTFPTIISWLGAASYAFQLYFDFSGYSDMAIGLGLIFGFRFLENFNYPYISKSITEFWRRWHISLSTWFKQYVYIPLGGNRVDRNRSYINLGIVFLLTGIWHGASWNFVFWGIWNGVFIILEKITKFYEASNDRFVNFFKHIYTIFVFVIGWVMFRADTMEYALKYIKNMFGLIEVHSVAYTSSYYLNNIGKLTFIVAILCSMPIFSKLSIVIEHRLKGAIVNLWLLWLFFLSSASIAASTYNPFIYFRF